MTEITGPGFKEERNFFLTLMDPFDIYGMIRGKDNETRFWDDDEVHTASRPAKDHSTHQTV